MASVNSTGSIYSSIVAQNKGIGGLATGLDTESIIEALTTGTRSKIAKQSQQKQIAQWKQTAYRSAATALKAFRETHLSFASANKNIGGASYFNTIKASTLSNKVKVTTTANSTLQDIKIDSIEKLATAQTIKSRGDIKMEIVGEVVDLDTPATKPDFTNKTLALTVDGLTKYIKLDTLNSSSNASLQTDLQNLVTDAFGTKTEYNAGVPSQVPVVDVSVSGGKISLENTSGQVTVAGKCEALGLESGASNRISVSTTKLGEIIGLEGDLVGDVFSFNINGTTFTAKSSDTVFSLMTKINSSNAGVRLSYNIYNGTFDMTAKSTGHANKIQMHDVQGNLLNELFGAKSASGVTSKELYKNDAFAADDVFGFEDDYNAVKGDEEKTKAFLKRLNEAELDMCVDGVVGTVKLNLSRDIQDKIKNGDPVTNQDIIDALNESIDETFGEDTTQRVKFVLGGDGRLSMTVPANELTVLSKGHSDRDLLEFLGFDTTEAFTSRIDLQPLKELSAQGSVTAVIPEIAEDSVFQFDLTINGVRKTISHKLTASDMRQFADLEDNDKPHVQASFLADKLNAAIFSEFGSAAGSISGGTVMMSVGFEADKDGKVKLHTAGGSAVTINSLTSADPDTHDALSILGFTAGANGLSNNAADVSTLTLSQFGVSGAGALDFADKTGNPLFSVLINDTDTLEDIVNKINSNSDDVFAYIKDGRLRIEGGDQINISSSGATNMLDALFGLDATGFKTAEEDYETRASGGTNAEIIMNGQLISQSSNIFTINGSKVEILATTDSSINETVDITMSSDPDELIDKLKDFIADYNALITTLNLMVTEKPDKNYFPLSDEQKADMSLDQIEKWEAEAKKGILRYDPTINGILSELRSVLYKGVGESEISLYGIGITTVSVLSSPEKNGHLQITPENEEKLRNAIMNNPDAVRELFTHATDGIAKSLDNVIDRAINTSSDNDKRGSLIAIAGTDTLTGDNTSSLDRQIKRYDEAIENLKKRLETEYKRYWSQFSALEVAISNMSSQSSWLTDFVAS